MSGMGVGTGLGYGGQFDQQSFIGASTNPTGFVSAAQLGATGMNQGFGNAGQQWLGGNYGGLNQFGMGQMGQRLGGGNMYGGGMDDGGNMYGGDGQMYVGQGQLNMPGVRTVMTVGIDSHAADSWKLNSAIAQHLTNLPSIHWSLPARVELQGGTAILRGVVATEHERDLAELVLRLDPTVDQVENLLLVAPSRAESPKRFGPSLGNSAPAGSAPAD
jgi:hypothetical protein